MIGILLILSVGGLTVASVFVSWSAGVHFIYLKIPPAPGRFCWHEIPVVPMPPDRFAYNAGAKILMGSPDAWIDPAKAGRAMDRRSDRERMLDDAVLKHSTDRLRRWISWHADIGGWRYQNLMAENAFLKIRAEFQRLAGAAQARN